VRDDLSPAHAAKTLVHERAHMLLGHVDSVASYEICRGQFEVEAESVACLICAGLGIDAVNYSLPYVARWANGDIELVRKTAERVVTVARLILDGLPPIEPRSERALRRRPWSTRPPDMTADPRSPSGQGTPCSVTRETPSIPRRWRSRPRTRYALRPRDCGEMATAEA
jgi:hypothetical protein